MKNWNYKKPKEEKILKPFTKDGYNNVRLWKEGKSEQVRVCDMVARAFVPNPENMPFVVHINGDLLDDRAVNLKWSWTPE
jgi:hypothetical protein